VNLTGMRT